MKWRAMTTLDLPDVKTLADAIHKDYPEDEAVFANRLALYPHGCAVLVAGKRVLGYSIAHPWRLGPPPALNTVLDGLPSAADTLYLHDVALSPPARGQKAADPRLEELKALARKAGFASLSLTAVSNTQGFWAKHGFKLQQPENHASAPQSYGPEARCMTLPLNTPC